MNFTCTAFVLWFCGYVATQQIIRIDFDVVMFLISICESIDQKKSKLEKLEEKMSLPMRILLWM